MRRLLFALVCLVAAAAPSYASAAQLIDRDAQHLKLSVNSKGEALLSYSSHGKTKHVLIWGAVNALPPSTARPQVRFKVDYAGGWGKYHTLYWKTFKNACRAYDGPKLPNVIAQCKAPDGSYWAVQQWPQPLPDLGFNPWTPEEKQQWMEVSHWSGPTAQLVAYTDWVYAGKFHDLFGNFTYQGQPVYGFGTTKFGAPTDGYGRLIYLDTYNSVYGAGWHRENSFVPHNPTGAFCYGFYSFDPTKGGYKYPPGQTGRRGPGVGSQYRLFGEGPGVTPDVEIYLNDPGDWDAADAAKKAIKQQSDAALDTVVGADKQCHAGHDF